MAKALLTFILWSLLLLLWFSLYSVLVAWSYESFPRKYSLKTSLRTSTLHYRFKEAEKEEDAYEPCEYDCRWEHYTPNSAFDTDIRRPFEITDDENVTMQRNRIACVPFSFGYKPERANELFPPFTYPLCKDKPSEVRPRLSLDNNTFSMTCANNAPGRYVLHPPKIPLTNQYFQYELTNKFPSHTYPSSPLYDVVGEYAIGSCGDAFTNAEMRPVYVREAEKRANATKTKRETTRKRPLSVVFVAVDSFSRRHFYRKLNQTISLLNSLNSNSSFTVFDFKVHNSQGMSSPGNMVPMFSNNSNFHSDDNPGFRDYLGSSSLWAIGRDWGFVTFVGFEYCGSNFINYLGKKLNVDHHVSTFYCGAKNTIGTDMGKESYKQRCIGPHMSHYYLLNYTHSFTGLYPASHQFTYIHLEAAHEETGQHAATLDKDLAEFIQALTRDYGESRDLAIFIQGDHGMAYGDWHHDVDADQEYRLPALFFLTQTSFLESIPNSLDTLWHNTYHLVTKADLRATILSLYGEAYAQEYPVHQEKYLEEHYVLTKEKIPDSRVCENSGIEPWLCACLKPTEEIQPEIIHSFGQSALENLLLRVVDEALRLINSQTFTEKTHISSLLCQKLTFESITRAYGYRLNNKMEQVKIEFTINELPSARIETYALIGSDRDYKLFTRSFDWTPLDPCEYLGYQANIRVGTRQVIDVSRKDKYAGPCETVSRANDIEAEFCVCHDLDRLKEERPALFPS